MTQALPVIVVFTFMLFSHLRHKETLRDIGWRMDNFKQAVRLLFLPIALNLFVFFLIGLFTGSLRMGILSRQPAMLIRLIWLLGWGATQQYGLQGFINRRAQIKWGRGTGSILVVAFIFAILHLPNPVLMLVTLVGGGIGATVYQRTPNLFALAISHALLTTILLSTVPATALHGMRVGLNFR